ncbi:MAG TPA: Fe-S cluster assembly protein SufD, partial [Steroidobacteraceae bacterium]
MSSPLLERIAGEHAALADSLPGGAVSRARRRRALDALLTSGLPTSRDENWRYANLRPLERMRFAPATVAADASSLDPASLPASVPGFVRYVFVDGVFSPEASIAAGAQVPGARVSMGAPGPVAAESGEPRSETAFALLNEAFATGGLRIEVEDSERAPRIEVVFIASASAQTGATAARHGASYPRLSIVAAPHARLELIERHVSVGDEPNFVDSMVDVRAHDGSRIEHYRLQQLGTRALWMDTLTASVARSAVYRLHGFALGAQSARSTLNVRLEGEGSELALHAVAAADRQQVLDTHAIVEHAAPHTRTDESFRGVAAGRSRVAFNGKIIVQPGSHGADSSQSLRGLLAGAEAEIDVRPQLEIYTDEVRCSHGATAGKLDDAMLFYLLSRGLDRNTAQRLLKWAFLEDVVSRVPVTELRRQIEASLASRL